MYCTFSTVRTLQQQAPADRDCLAVLRQLHVSGRVHIFTHVQISFCGIDLALSGNARLALKYSSGNTRKSLQLVSSRIARVKM